jgi:hypothetical protein
MAALMLLAIPNATQEFMSFLKVIVAPVNADDGAALAKYMSDNPELEEMLGIFDRLAEQEAKDLASLVGKAKTMFKRILPLYRSKKS